MRLGLLLLMLVMTVAIAHITSILVRDSWSAANMGRAYEQGCLLASAPLTLAKVSYCAHNRATYQETILYTETVE